MAVSINEAHQFIRSVLKKNKAGFVSPEDIDRFINRSISDFISAIIYKFKRTKDFDYDHLLVKRQTFTVTPSTSVQTVPADYFEGLTIYVSNNGNQVEGTLYNWDEFLEVKNSVILAPDLSYPAATIFVDANGDGKIEFAPVPASGSHTFTLVYVRKPLNAVFNYTTSSGNITFNSAGSVDIDLSDRYMGDIYGRTLMYLGITLENPTFLQAETLKDANQKQDER